MSNKLLPKMNNNISVKENAKMRQLRKMLKLNKAKITYIPQRRFETDYSSSFYSFTTVCVVYPSENKNQ